MTESDVPTGLMFVDAPAAPTTFNVLAFGPVGSGKSTAAATLAKYGAVLWLNLEGPGALSYARKIAGNQILEVRLNVAEVRKPTDKDGTDPHQTLREFVRFAKTEPRPATVVIDTIGKLRDALAAQYVQPGHRGVRDQWGEVAKILRSALGVLRDLPCNLILLAHQEINEGDGDERIIRPKIGGALTEDIPAEMDVVTYTSVVVVQDDENDPSTRRKVYYGQLVDGNGRQGLKDRSGGLGLYRELDFSEWLPVYCAALAPDNSDLPFDPDASAEAEAQLDLDEARAVA